MSALLLGALISVALVCAVLAIWAVIGSRSLARHEREDAQPYPSERGIW